MKRGSIHIEGDSGVNTAVLLRGGTIVTGNTGEFAGAYMKDGILIIQGKPGLCGCKYERRTIFYKGGYDPVLLSMKGYQDACQAAWYRKMEAMMFKRYRKWVIVISFSPYESSMTAAIRTIIPISVTGTTLLSYTYTGALSIMPCPCFYGIIACTLGVQFMGWSAGASLSNVSFRNILLFRWGHWSRYCMDHPGWSWWILRGCCYWHGGCPTCIYMTTKGKGRIKGK